MSACMGWRGDRLDVSAVYDDDHACNIDGAGRGAHAKYAGHKCVASRCVALRFVTLCFLLVTHAGNLKMS